MFDIFAWRFVKGRKPRFTRALILFPVKAEAFNRFRLSCLLPGGLGAHCVFSLQVIDGLLFHDKILLRPEFSLQAHYFAQLIGYEKRRGRTSGNVVRKMLILFLAIADGKLEGS